MKLASLIAALSVIAAAGCGSPSAPGDQPSSRTERGDVFEPLVETIDRAADVQQTVDERAAELRRRVEEAEGARE